MSAPDTLTLSALRTAVFAPGQLGVLGDPIAHSLSPAMHNAALAMLLPTHPRLAGVRYHRLHITAEELPEALTLLHAQGFAGVNLTVPHKIPALTLVETLSPEARRAESVNTLVRTPTGWSRRTSVESCPVVAVLSMVRVGKWTSTVTSSTATGPRVAVGSLP